MEQIHVHKQVFCCPPYKQVPIVLNNFMFVNTPIFIFFFWDRNIKKQITHEIIIECVTHEIIIECVSAPINDTDHALLLH